MSWRGVEPRDIPLRNLESVTVHFQGPVRIQPRMSYCERAKRPFATPCSPWERPVSTQGRACVLFCPAVFANFSPRPRQNRSCGTNPINQSSQSWLIVNQSINRKSYNDSLRLIDWFNPLSEKLPHGDDFRVGPKSDRPLRANTLLNHAWQKVIAFGTQYGQVPDVK